MAAKIARNYGQGELRRYTQDELDAIATEVWCRLRDIPVDQRDYVLEQVMGWFRTAMIPVRVVNEVRAWFRRHE